MEVTNKTKGEAIVFYLNGDLTTTNSPEAQTEINEVLESTECKLVVIVVCSANQTNKSVFKMSGFTRIFSIFDTEEEALQLI
jgi:anti-anti-sigma regulatory factor